MFSLTVMRAVLCASLVAVAAGTPKEAIAETCPDRPINISINPSVYAYLPFYVAIEKGFFTEEGVALNVIKYSGSATTQLPMLARGDLDISPTVLGPSFFNQFVEGFDVKVIASVQQSQDGWRDSTWILVRKEIAETVTTFSDLKGLRVDGGPQGSPINQLTKLALEQGGLTRSDVIYTENFRAPTDFFGAFRNDAIDVLSSPEPIATQLEMEGLAVRWKSISDLKPGWQELFIGASPDYLKNCPDKTTAFLKAYLRAAELLTTAGPEWTPEILAIAVKWTGIPEEVLRNVGGPTYVGHLGQIDMERIQFQYDFWREEGTISGEVVLDEIVDTSNLKAASDM